MVLVNIPDKGRVITDRNEAAKYLAELFSLEWRCP